MPVDYNLIERASTEFNAKYGLEFDIEAFEERVGAFEISSDGSAMDAVYDITVSEMMRRALGNVLDCKIGGRSNPFSYTQMLIDFEEKIMTPYRNGRLSENRHAPSPYGNRPLSARTEAAFNYLHRTAGNSPTSVFALKRYDQNDLSFDDIKKHSENIMNNGEESIEKLRVLKDYQFALGDGYYKSWLWKLFHLSRYLAEQKLAKTIEDYVEEKCTQYARINSDYDMKAAHFEKMESFNDDTSETHLGIDPDENRRKLGGDTMTAPIVALKDMVRNEYYIARAKERNQTERSSPAENARTLNNNIIAEPMDIISRGRYEDHQRYGVDASLINENGTNEYSPIVKPSNDPQNRVIDL